MLPIIKLFAVIGSLALFGCNKSSPTPAAKDTTPDKPFTIVKPEKKALPKFIDQPGTVFAYEEAPLYAKYAGYVKKYHVDIGDKVVGPVYDKDGKVTNPKDWTVLAELNIPEREDEVRQKEALVQQAEAQRDQALAQENVGKSSYEAAQAVVKQAEAARNGAVSNLQRWDSENKRIAKLVAQKIVDPQTGDETNNQYLTAKSAMEEAEAKVTAAEKSAARARSEWDKAKADVKAADAKVNVAKADRDLAKSLSDYRFIRAPFNGVVTRRSKADPGKFVYPAGSDLAEPLFTVMNMERVRIQVLVPEADAGLISRGIDATVNVQNQNIPDFKATVTRTSESLDPATRTLLVEMERANEKPKLKAGTYVNVRIAAPMPEAWVLPNNAIVKQADVVICFRYEGGRAVRMPIRTGRSDDKYTEVIQKQLGDNWFHWTGDEPILAGQTANLKDGQEVRVGQ